MKLRTRYQRTEAAVQLARQIRERAVSMTREDVANHADAIITLLAAPAEVRAAQQADILYLIEGPRNSESFCLACGEKPCANRTAECNGRNLNL